MRTDFTERMETARDVAMRDRNRGTYSGRAHFPAARREQMDRNSWAWLVHEQRAAWRGEKRQAQNDFAAACLNGSTQGDFDGLAF